jgi:hypothetical protein
VGQAHALATHEAPLAQVVPHLPQFVRFVVVSTQAPFVPQAPWPAAHWQVPEKQNWLAGQTLPQEPQLIELPVVSTHEDPQSLSEPAHPLAHLLCEHTMPAAQAVPHAPQFFASEVVSTQPVEHIVCPARQPQTPALHACPVRQMPPHLPQLAGSDEVRTQLDPHKVEPEAHDAGPPASTTLVDASWAVEASTTLPLELLEPPPDEDEELPEGATEFPPPSSGATLLAQSADSTQVATVAAKTANPRTNRRTEVRSIVLTLISYFTLPNGGPTTTVAMSPSVGSRPRKRSARPGASVTSQTNRYR